MDFAPIFSLGIMPYYAMCIDGILKFFEDKNYNIIFNNNYEYRKVLEKIRCKTKMYNNKINKNSNIVNNIHKNQNNIFRKMLKFKFLEKFNFYYDFGTYIVSNKFVGNTFMYNWYLNEISNIKTNKVENSIFCFSKAMGELLSCVYSEFLYSKQLYVPIKKIDKIHITNRDFNLNKIKTSIFNNKYDKSVTILIFNILCSINFVQYLLNQILPEKNLLQFRIRYTCYYYAVSSLKALIRFSEQNQNIKTGVENYEVQIHKLSQLENGKFRNFILHYKISENDLKANEIIIDVPFYGLIEKYTGTDYLSINKEISNKLKQLSILLEKWILTN
jgi:hypothetical protein